MELNIINIGNSKGIRLSKNILQKYNIGEKVELIFEKDFIILKAKPQPRKNWGKAFEEMHKNGDDRLQINDVFEDEEFE